jgi:hypothetical protein
LISVRVGKVQLLSLLAPFIVTTIQELAKTTGFRGPANHKFAEPGGIRTLPIIDNSVPTRSNIRTSVDCYVSGQYLQKNGNVIEVTQRYTIFVSYSHDTQMQTMSQVRERIIQDFESRYGKEFNVTTVFVPDLPVPPPKLPGVGAGEIAPLEMYRGSDLFKQITAYEKLRYDVGTENVKSRINIDSLRDRYRNRYGRK